MMKKLLATLCGTKPSLCSVHTVPSKRPNTWVQFRLRPNKSDSVLAPLTYSAEIPVLLRRIALACEYGPDSTLVAQTAAGNVGSHSISLRQNDWDRFFDALEAVRTCAAPDADEALKLNVALSYLRNRTYLNNL